MTSATNFDPRRVGSVRYYVGGEGEPLLLLHGLAGSTGNWVELLPDLLKRYRVLAVDLPGHAGSGRLPRGASTADFAAVAAAVLEAEAPGPALVAGHSFGGLVALRLARSRPELVRGLLLVSPAGISVRHASRTGDRARVDDDPAGPRLVASWGTPLSHDPL